MNAITAMTTRRWIAPAAILKTSRQRIQITSSTSAIPRNISTPIGRRVAPRPLRTSQAMRHSQGPSSHELRLRRRAPTGPLQIPQIEHRLAPEAIREQILDDRFRALGGGRKGIVPVHRDESRTLGKAIIGASANLGLHLGIDDARRDARDQQPRRRTQSNAAGVMIERGLG